MSLSGIDDARSDESLKSAFARDDDALVVSAPSLYDVLGVSRTASRVEIRSAYQRRCKLVHPDRINGGQQQDEQFKMLTISYRILHNPATRELYDKGGDVATLLRFEQRDVLANDVKIALTKVIQRMNQLPTLSEVLRSYHLDVERNELALAVENGDKKLPEDTVERIRFGFHHITDAIQRAIDSGFICVRCAKQIPHIDALCYCAEAAVRTHCLQRACCEIQQQLSPSSSRFERLANYFRMKVFRSFKSSLVKPILCVVCLTLISCNFLPMFYYPKKVKQK